MVNRNGYAVVPNPNYKEYPDYGPGKCRVCGIQLHGHERFYCGAQHQRDWYYYGRKTIRLFWSELRDRIVHKYGVCARCGGNDRLEVHHIIPLYLGGDQFDENNLKVLCTKCHDYAHRTLPKTLKKHMERERGIEPYIQMTLDSIKLV